MTNRYSCSAYLVDGCLRGRLCVHRSRALGRGREPPRRRGICQHRLWERVTASGGYTVVISVATTESPAPTSKTNSVRSPESVTMRDVSGMSDITPSAPTYALSSGSISPDVSGPTGLRDENNGCHERDEWSAEATVHGAGQPTLADVMIEQNISLVIFHVPSTSTASPSRSG